MESLFGITHDGRKINSIWWMRFEPGPPTKSGVSTPSVLCACVFYPSNISHATFIYSRQTLPRSGVIQFEPFSSFFYFISLFLRRFNQSFKILDSISVLFLYMREGPRKLGSSLAARSERQALFYPPINHCPATAVTLNKTSPRDISHRRHTVRLI